jgi:dTDP-4-amino-4,6-dideoxygalactose transaminase
LALRGLNLPAGAKVATVSHTAVATVAAIEMAGLTPVLVDIDPTHYTLDPGSLESAIAAQPANDPIRAVVVVHLYGQAADLDALQAIARQHGLKLIEDCAQCHGATWRGKRLGSFGDVSAYSLYPTKNLAALGDGGVITTDDTALAERLAALRQYGWRSRYVSDLVGVNTRLDEIQAAVLSVRLGYLDAENARRRAIAARYDAELSGLPIGLPAQRAGGEHVFHQYVIRSDNRPALQAALREHGVGTNIHYPMPIHLQPAYRGRVPTAPAGLPETEKAASAVLSLPMFPQLGDADVGRVCEAMRACTGPRG